jgi:predicted PhzF superfamily epimerase YddE/YHI9
VRFFVVDAFTGNAFSGNPASVVLVEGDFPADAWLQSVAAEFRHAETAFVRPIGERAWDLRWFTPIVEIDLCGHATLATAHVLGGDNTFRTRGGVLRSRTASPGWVELDFPADPTEPVEPSAELRAALGGAQIVAAGRGRYDLLVQVGSEEQVRALRPDFDALGRMPHRGVLVTAADGSANGVVSRCFYPAVGTPEDPAAGSAHCTIGGWWFERLGVEELTARQLSARGGALRVARRGDRVLLTGQAVTVMRGELAVPVP